MMAGKFVEEWWLNSAEEYDFAIDSLKSPNGNSSIILYSAVQWPKESCFICKTCSPENYRDRKVTYSAWLKTELLSASVQLWIRVDTEDQISRPGCFDNMYETRIKTSTDWQEISLTVHVPKDSTKIVYGAILSGAGKAWISSPLLTTKK